MQEQVLQFIRCASVQFLDCMAVDVQGSGYVRMSKTIRDGPDVYLVPDQESGSSMPLRYNNDKQKKPLFSRGLSVCRLLFNSFSKLKIDENYKEKRRLFY